MTNIQIRLVAPQLGRLVTTGCYCMLGLLLSACGSSDQAGTPQPEVKRQTSTSASKAEEPKNPLADMVKAVPTAAGEKSVELRFELPKQPVLGEPIDLDLNVLGLADATALELKVIPQPNVQVIAGGDAALGALKTGESVRHTLRIRASANGISVIDVQLVATVDGKPHTADFAIPVALVAAPAAAVATAGK